MTILKVKGGKQFNDSFSKNLVINQYQTIK